MNRRKFIRNISLLSAAGMFFTDKVFAKEAPLPVNYKPNPFEWKNNEINIAWIGHSTVLINFYGTIILTDPVLYQNIGLYFWGLTFGPSRLTESALELQEIPKPDILLISHAHMDHMDYKSLSRIASEYPDQIDCITAQNTKDVIEDLKWKSLQEIDWGEEASLHGVKLKAYEVKHFGWRFPWEEDRSRGFMKQGRSYNSILIEKNNRKILFGGDTAYHQMFKSLKDENVDIAIMPIGAYRPWKWNHSNPEEALMMACNHIRAKYFIPVHTKTFRQGIEPVEEPLRWLADSEKNYDIEVGIRDIGETFTLRS